ncbi:MAG: CoA ester lyase [Corynebacterium sp.]|nr:CoA ester lyase [Corynebacterium sp.]
MAAAQQRTPGIIGPALLFAPANRPEIFAKAAKIADTVILDLEDGAGNIDRGEAYENIRQANLDPTRTIVRIVGPDDPHFVRDVDFVSTLEYDTIMIPKIRASLPAVEKKIIAMVETPQAVLHLANLVAETRLVGLLWGAEDLTMELGGTHSRYGTDEQNSGMYRETMRFARTLMHFHAQAAGIMSFDAVYADFNDAEGLKAEALDAARSGFSGTACIHPRQVAIIQQAYYPTEEQRAWAQKVVDKAEHYPGAFQLEGEMIDAPLIAQAHRVVARAKAGNAEG